MAPAVTAGSGDPRTARTRGRLRAALLAACEEQPLDRVSVSEVVRRAGVGRATFYLHYADLRALAVDACAEVVRLAVEALHAWGDAPARPDAPPAELAGLLGAVRDRAEVYRSLLGPGGGGPLGELLHEELRSRSLAELRRRRPAGTGAEVTAAAVAGLFCGVLADWVHARIDATPAQLAARVWRMLIAVHAAAASHGQGTPAAGGASPLR
ncbi:TetR family transcriptional regulator [Streptomyces sp. RKAG290]|uniref:TetR/AcrR family transcriptional regulator n=1 Tax=Streptomyces sp. RKAG290 TaxID=2888348 RepID=UPI0020349FC3|nr:TetR family transcriptional regulator [Streptomyces sp. RKAG290]MCM2414972.1 TetR/AcrR family transcriptional regulator [Streptomyces sp. RKAG290]